MSRYFLDLRHGPGLQRRCEDPEGDEIADAGLLREHALRAARRTARTPSVFVRDWWACVFEVRDAHGRIVLRVPFADGVETPPPRKTARYSEKPPSTM